MCQKFKLLSYMKAAVDVDLIKMLLVKMHLKNNNEITPNVTAANMYIFYHFIPNINIYLTGRGRIRGQQEPCILIKTT